MAIRAERQAKAEADAQRLRAEAAIENGEADFTDAGFLDGLRAQVRAANEAADAQYSRVREQQLVAQYGEEGGRAAIEQERAEAAEVKAFLAMSDPLYESEAFRAEEQANWAQERAEEVAATYFRTMEDDAAEAEAGIRETLARVGGAEFTLLRGYYDDKER